MSLLWKLALLILDSLRCCVWSIFSNLDQIMPGGDKEMFKKSEV